jgi:hypothetical protein
VEFGVISSIADVVAKWEVVEWVKLACLVVLLHVEQHGLLVGQVEVFLKLAMDL